MEPEVVAAWVSDQHVLLYTCSDPDACRLPLEYSISPSRRRCPDGASPAAKRRRAPLANVDPNSDRKMPSSGEPDLRRSPRRKGSKQPGDQDPFESDNTDADTAIYGPDLQATPRPRKVLLQQQPIFPVPMSFTTKLSASDRQSVASGSRERLSCASGRTRSTSPVKKSDDLLKLEKPVSWTTPDPRTLRDAVKATGSTQALRLFDDVWRIIQGEGYLPRELKGILKEELMVSDSRFAAGDRVVVMSQKERDDARQLFPLLGADEGRTFGLLALHGELNAIREIVATTIRFINTSRSEATWNDHIHGPILRLAVSSTPYVGAENITQAAIAKAFVPAARGDLETLGSKMIDYALLLRPEKHLAVRIADFVDGFDAPRTFNQSTHGALCYEPTGVLVETKVDIRRRAEGKAQLGIWLAAWYGRVARFAPLPSGDAGIPTNLPFLPVLLVVCENWELYFAFDGDGEFEVCGPLEIGSTVTVDGSYRLLAVLRLLAGWVAGEFRGWVERCVA
ncbi:hypothetical protein DL766_005245 [Monosporascus sp. MC13-8B]|uniref:PD-(D/E)XK nuclease-like domain-containing protein n=1 Tax=Monosporascus cannonballus TaxID=155416 RepID=A0ABY0GUP6_9PEZI|nr:hypothetical protein DL762_009071 [Monosporascus cannonballus]RYP29690.1 hypothetical protein DL766_005245 [Monosporascus sp. MC13-8B]